MGYDPVPLADEAAIMATMQPKEAMGLRMVIPQVISLGFGRDVEPEDDEVDLGLAELNAHKKNQVTRAHYLRIGTLCGLSAKESLLSAPGELMDQWELYLQAHGAKKQTEYD